MKKYGFTVLAIPGLALASVIGMFAFGNGPELKPIPERLAAVEDNSNIQNKESALELSTPAPMLGETNEKKQKSKKLLYTKKECGYKDGTYTGSAQGYGGMITVKVVIREGKITSVDIISAAGETPSFLAKAKPITAKIVSAQNPNVDAVSGATYSSNGIINAVIVALNKAGATNLTTKNRTDINSNTPKPKQNPQNDRKKSTPMPTKLPKDTKFENGTYYGSGEGFGGTIKAKVVIKKNKIDAIDIVSAEYETPSYFANAKKILVTMKKKQSPEVDVISGATYSSNGIKDAVREALQKAVKNNSAVKKPKVTAKPKVTIQPTPTKVPKPVPTAEVKEDGSIVTVTTIPYEKVVMGNAICYPDEYEDFIEYPICINLMITGEKIRKTTTKGDEEITEEENTYSVSAISFAEETKKLAQSEGNWFYLKRAAEGFGTKMGIFNQLVSNNQATKVDAVTAATCSSDAIWRAFLDGVKKISEN
ncbi:MAG: FMN-binding protein [Lachnospiraceae bacterium]|nr:FMN-binding protein [Lachnospiraceae bacterium]